MYNNECTYLYYSGGVEGTYGAIPPGALALALLCRLSSAGNKFSKVLYIVTLIVNILGR
jgi:hypothetical protein